MWEKWVFSPKIGEKYVTKLANCNIKLKKMGCFFDFIIYLCTKLECVIFQLNYNAYEKINYFIFCPLCGGICIFGNSRSG